MVTKESAFLMALRDIEEEKGIPQEVLLSLLEEAIIKAYKKRYGGGENISLEWNKKKGTFKLFVEKMVVENVVDPAYEISLDESLKIRKTAKLGKFIKVPVQPKDFSRVVANTIRNTLAQALQNTQRGLIYERFKDRIGELVTGKIIRIHKGNVFLMVSGVEALLPRKEQMPNDVYLPEKMLRVVIIDVKKDVRGAQLIVSRAHPDLVCRLFESEISEFSEGLLEIKGAVREPGERTKIAIYAKRPDLDPIGTCVGQRGTRIHTITRELNGEKIDIIAWSPDPKIFITNALSPAPVLAVDLDIEEKEASVIVPEDKQSLAIGKGGQNVRLAARLTGWKIDIKSDAEVRKREAVSVLDAMQGIQREFEDTPVKDLDGIGEKTLQKLIAGGFTVVKDLLDKTPKDLAHIPGIGEKTAEKILKAIRKLKEKADREKEARMKEQMAQAPSVETTEELVEPFLFEDGREVGTIEELKKVALELPPDELKGYLERGDFEAWLEYAGYSEEEIQKFIEEVQKKAGSESEGSDKPVEA